MSDYMYLLDSLVSREQSQLLTAVQNASAELGVALYLTGGAMRDMLGGFPIRDLDFTFEGHPPSKLTAHIAKSLPDLQIEDDGVRKIAELRLPSGVTGSLRMAHTEKVSKPGAVPKVTPAHLLEDLSRRDFTINAMAISLARASRGLIRDPLNGQSDLSSREIRVCYTQAFFDDPVRLLRAIRLKHRLGFQIEERTQRYFLSAIEEGAHRVLTPEDWRKELVLIASENAPSEILKELDETKLLPVPAESLNLEGLARFEKLRLMIPGRAPYWPLFLYALMDSMKPKDRAALNASFALLPADTDPVKKIKPRAAKLAETLKSPALRRPSQIYNAVSEYLPIENLLLMYDSDVRMIQDRMRNYFEKFLPEASEITDAQVEATGAKLGTPQFKKAKTALIAAKLNAPAVPPPEVPNGVGGPGGPPAAGPGHAPGPPVRAIR